MKASYKIALGLAAVLAIVIIGFAVTSNDDTADPVDQGQDTAQSDATPGQTRTTLRNQSGSDTTTDTPRGDTGTSGNRTTSAQSTTDAATGTGTSADSATNRDLSDLMQRVRQSYSAAAGTGADTTGGDAATSGGQTTGDGQTSSTAGQPDGGYAASDTSTTPPTGSDDTRTTLRSDASGSTTASTTADPGEAATRSRGTGTTSFGQRDTLGGRTPTADTDQGNAAATSTTTPTTTARARTYTVKQGDNLSTIAEQQFGSERYWVDIAQANPMIDPTRLRIGQEIRLPSEADLRTGVAEDELDAPADTVTYTIRAGDTLSTIAQQHYGSSAQWRVIYNANRDRIGPNPDRISAGMKLVVPPALPEAR